MKRNSRVQVVASALIPFALVALVGAGKPPVKKVTKIKPVPFSKIAPLLKAECVMCHNEKRHAEGVDLSSYKATMAGGEGGPTVVPGHPEKSSLIAYVDGTKKPQMPMKMPPLKAAQVTLLKSWIASGAKN